MPSEDCPRCDSGLSHIGPSPKDTGGPTRYECVDCNHIWTAPELEAERDE